jgi:tRNA threonylcarbamoyladenosine biosynthesis protein TsaB
MGKPAIGISSLAALARFGTADLRAPVIDAKRGEVYAALYDRAGPEIIPATVLPFEAFLKLIGDRTVEYISAGFALGFQARLPFTAAPHELAGTIARLAIQSHLSGDLCDPASIEANYVRRSDAELFWKE